MEGRGRKRWGDFGVLVVSSGRDYLMPCFLPVRISQTQIQGPISRIFVTGLGLRCLVPWASIFWRLMYFFWSRHRMRIGDWASKCLQVNVSRFTYYKIHLLALPGTTARKLYLYAACIPPAFLDKFDQPLKFSPSGPILIAHYSLPLQNAEKLPKRLLRALRAPVE